MFRCALFARICQRPVVSSISLVRNASTQSAAAEKFDKIYELRTYSIQPKHYSEFLQCTADNFHLRTAHSKLIGYWTTELGGINEVVSLWEYDNFAHRTTVRKALASDKEWIAKYYSKVLPMFVSQQNVVLYAFPWYQPKLDSDKQYGVYELVVHTLRPGMLPQWDHRVQQGYPARLAMDYPPPLGFWYSEFGQLSTVYHIWPHKSLDKRVEHRKGELFQDEVWRETFRDTMHFIQNMYVKALVPTSFSPLK